MMPDEMGVSEDAEETEAIPPIVHDDIMHRLLDYQRQLRSGSTPEQAADHAVSPVLVDDSALDSPPPIAEEPETVEVIDLVAVEDAVEDAAEEPTDVVSQIWAVSSVTSEPTAVQPTPTPAADVSEDIAARLAKLEGTLSNIATSIAELRAEFQNMAIAADERLAEIESMMARAKDEAAAS